MEPIKPIDVSYNSRQRARNPKSPSIMRQIEVAKSDASQSEAQQDEETQEDTQSFGQAQSINIPVKRKEPKSPLEELESAADELEGKSSAPPAKGPSLLAQA